MSRRYPYLLLILLAAAALRLVNLSSVPPGLTHDEADHGQDAWGVVNGDRPIYFTVGYGREPFFDYATAGLMAVLGPTYLAGRLTAAYFSLILLAGTYTWVRRAFDDKTALLTAAGLAVSFWAVMTGRQALRSVTMPALFILAVFFFWRGLAQSANRSKGLQFATGAESIVTGARRPTSTSFFSFAVAGVLLGISVYTYFPARILWVIFPALLLFQALFDRQRFSGIWRGTLLMLLLAAVVSAPLIFYLVTHPSAELRLDQLSRPLTAAGEGDFEPLLANAVASLRLLTFEGDVLARYNIPGRPFLTPVMAALFLTGLSLAVWRIVSGIRNRDHTVKAGALFFAVLWFVAGLSPALITGPDASTTRIIGMQPVLFLFPALVLTAMLDLPFVPQRAGTALTALLFAGLLILTVRDYFFTWANDPEVRVQYETTLVTAIDYLNENGRGPAALSTTTPDRFHSPSAALLTLDNPDVALRWFNGQHSLIIPGDGGTVIFTGFAPLSLYLAPYFDGDLKEEIPLRSTDLDRPLSVYTVDRESLLARAAGQFSGAVVDPRRVTLPVMFDPAVELLGYDLQTPAITPGDVVRLATLWRARQAADDLVLFTHLVGPDGVPLAQADRLDVPSAFWYSGDIFIQLHQFTTPADMSPGDYPLLVGVYARPENDRLLVTVDGLTVSDHIQLSTVSVKP